MRYYPDFGGIEQGNGGRHTADDETEEKVAASQKRAAVGEAEVLLVHRRVGDRRRAQQANGAEDGEQLIKGNGRDAEIRCNRSALLSEVWQENDVLRLFLDKKISVNGQNQQFLGLGTLLEPVKETG